MACATRFACMSRSAPITTRQQTYNHVDEAARLDAITKINRLRGTD
jgi:hypothetical protein